MVKVRIGDIDINYEIHGEGSPLLLITGFTGSIDHYWNSIHLGLVQKYKLILFDSRGMGKSSCLDIPYSIEMMAEDTMGLIDHLELERPTILGHSMGACIAMEMGRKFGRKIDNLILVNPFAKFNQRTRILYQAIDQLFEENIPQEKIFWTAIPWLFSNEHLQDTKVVEELRKFFRKRVISKIGFKRQLQALIEFNATPWLKKINHQTLIIASQNDILTPLYQAEELRDKIPESNLVVIKGGHASHQERPNDLVKLITDYLA